MDILWMFFLVSSSIFNLLRQKSPRIDNIRGLCLVKGLTKLHISLALVT